MLNSIGLSYYVGNPHFNHRPRHVLVLQLLSFSEMSLWVILSSDNVFVSEG